MKRPLRQGALILAVALGLTAAARANHLIVTNVSLVNTDKAAGSTDVQFDLGWENSWRAAWVETNTGGYGNIGVTNWDAAWVFVKWRNVNSNWNHAWLAASGHWAPAGMTTAVGNTSGTNVGVFVYRATNGYGSLNLAGVKLRWNYAANGLATTNALDVSVHAIEMVYIPEGSFYLASGGTEAGSFTEGSWVTNAITTFPFRVTSEAPLTISNAAGCLWGTVTNGMPTAAYNTIGEPGVLSNIFPKGYGAFYCMKHEITQGQYAEFLNQLTSTQAVNHYPGYYSTNRQTIVASPLGGYSNSAPDRAANYLAWADGAAYGDWSGLRPMTELEFEKACRGPKAPVANEKAWGDTSVTLVTNFAGTDGSGLETALPTNANFHGNIGGSDTPISGPVRVGMFASTNSARQQAGAGYYGVMELNGNMHERIITAGHTAGRSFRGNHGDGILDTNGYANESSWPGVNARGAAFRGNDCSGYFWLTRISDRNWGTLQADTRGLGYGWRGVRTAP